MQSKELGIFALGALFGYSVIPYCIHFCYLVAIVVAFAAGVYLF